MSLEKKTSLAEAVRKAYRLGQEDEALEPVVKTDASDRPLGRFEDGDYVIFYNIRGEREIEITQSLTDPQFSHFPRKTGLRLNFSTIVEYAPGLNVKVVFPPLERLKNTLVEVASRKGLRIAKVAESEKAPHIEFFLNGKRHETFPGEERFIVPSPHNVAYDKQPEMSAGLVAEKIAHILQDPSYTLIIANLANVDVVGHIENRSAVLQAVEAVDDALGKILEECRKAGVVLVVTSDHGTVEEWTYPNGSTNTGHTKNQVPFILADFSSEAPNPRQLRREGELADVAPTVLELLGLEKPEDMTGRSLISAEDKRGGLKNRKRRLVLAILDGWGMRREKEGNLIAEARTPNFDRIWSGFPQALLAASGEAVGMPSDAVGNSEAGHLHIGAGRRVLLDRVRIDGAVADGSFFRNETLLWVMEEARRQEKAVHLMGIVSHYSSHGTIEHLFALLRLAKERGPERVYIHAFIGRRGEIPESGAVYVKKIEETTESLGCGELVTVMGRFWSLDREENWDRVEKAYRALVYGEGTKVRPE